MKQIVITGLDGSGKSTFLNKIGSDTHFHEFEIIYVPRIDTRTIENNVEIYKTAVFINNLNEKADQFKIWMAMFRHTTHGH